jgi:hypothetical protein
MTISCRLLAIGIMCLTPAGSIAQNPDVVQPYAKSTVKVDWIRGTDFTKYKTYAWGTSHTMTPDPNHSIDLMIETALKAKGLSRVEMDANPSLIVAMNAGNRLVYTIQDNYGIIKQGSLVVELADPKLKKAVWWGIAEEALADKHDKDLSMIQKKISKMFKKYPPPPTDK